jgi:hypothetical protein
MSEVTLPEGSQHGRQREMESVRERKREGDPDLRYFGEGDAVQII